MPVQGDDSQGFPDRERADILEHWLPTFEWTRFEEPSPRVPMPLPLAQARIGIVTTAGGHVTGTPPLGASGRAAVLPADARVTFTHAGFDTERAARDPEVVYPVGTLQRLVESGAVGEAASTTLSTMGGVLIAQRLVDRALPVAVEWAREERLDLALLVPA